MDFNRFNMVQWMWPHCQSNRFRKTRSCGLFLLAVDLQIECRTLCPNHRFLNVLQLSSNDDALKAVSVYLQIVLQGTKSVPKRMQKLFVVTVIIAYFSFVKNSIFQNWFVSEQICLHVPVSQKLYGTNRSMEVSYSCNRNFFPRSPKWACINQ